MGSALWVSTQEEMRMRGGGRLGRRVLGRAIKEGSEVSGAWSASWELRGSDLRPERVGGSRPVTA